MTVKKIFMDSNKKFLSNLSWLYILNILNLLIPFLVIPYLTRVLMPESYGIFSFALSIMVFLQVIIDYGFNLVGVNSVAKNIGNINIINKIFSTIVYIKFMLFVIIYGLLLLILNSFELLETNKEIYFIFSFLLLSNVLMPNWLLQGLQNVKIIAVVSFFVRIVYLISVFFFVKQPSDVYLYAFLYSISFFLIAIISLIYIKYKYKMKFIFVKWDSIISYLKEGFNIFISNFLIKVMGTMAIIILGIFESSYEVGIYAVISKLGLFMMYLYYPIGQAYFPIQSRLFKDSFEKGYLSAKNIIRRVLPVYLIVILLTILFREQIITVFFGEAYLTGATILVFLVCVPAVSVISNVMGTQILVASGNSKEYKKSFIKGLGIAFIFYILLGYYFEGVGVAFATLLSELLVVFFMLLEVNKLLKKQKGI